MEYCISLALLAVYLITYCCQEVNGQLLDETLNRAEEQLDRLTSRLVSLNNQLDSLLQENEDGNVDVERSARKLDKLEGDVTYVYTLLTMLSQLKKGCI